MVRVGRESSEPAGRADESLRLFSRLVSDLVHQFTQPLTVMQGLLEGAMLPGRTATQDTVLLESLGREVDRLSHMVRRIREMAEIESAVEQDLAVPLVQSVKRIVEQMASGAEPQELKVQVNASQEILVWSSPQRLEWCLQKLIGGALQRSPKCGKVRISISSSSVAAILKVSDQGPHIFGRSLNRLADPLPRCFATSLKSERDGLEWALAQWMFESSGASLVVRNRAKQGCVVTVTLSRRRRGKPRLKIEDRGIRRTFLPKKQTHQVIENARECPIMDKTIPNSATFS
jgi:K+-sensing histidine kinase KdpD